MNIYNNILEYIDENEFIDVVDNSSLNNNISNENDSDIDLDKYEDCIDVNIDELIEDCIDEYNYNNEIINKNDINLENKHLLFTNILNEQKIQKNRKEYNNWLYNNYDMLKNAYYILSVKYFNNKLQINFDLFTEFCFLYY